MNPMEHRKHLHVFEFFRTRQNGSSLEGELVYLSYQLVYKDMINARKHKREKDKYRLK